jgi:serine-type D-Ala-D-Ala carboxypeptidase/endopeptidase
VKHLERAIAETRLRRPPGEKMRYSNFGFGLLGHVLALRSGTTYEDLVLERVCVPLRLADTSVTVEPSAQPRLATGHDRRGRPVPHWDLPTLAGAGALRSTVADMLTFLALHLDAPDTRLGRAAKLATARRLGTGKHSSGLGWARGPLRGGASDVVWHNGGTGGFRSFAGFVEDARTAVVVLSNSARSVDAIGFRLLETLSER